MDLGLLERIISLTELMRSEGRDVYLGASGIPFTIEGRADGLNLIRVDLEAIQRELDSRQVVPEGEGA